MLQKRKARPGVMDVTCPKTFSCSGDNVSFDIGPIPSYISITSSCLSCLGSALILITYLTLKDVRTGAQKVITLLAIADFFTAFGYVIGSTNFLTHFNETDDKGCRIFETVCEIQSFVTTWSTMCSYCWTCILAFYFFLVLVYNKGLLAARLIPLYNIIAWLCPLTIVFPLLATGQLGYAPYVASNWCYIKDTDYDTKLSEKPLIIALLLLAGKFWEIISYVLVMSLYIVIRISMSKSHDKINPQMAPKVGTVEKRLLAIPLLYIFLRMWGTLQFFYSLGVSGTIHKGCIPKPVQIIFFIFGILQAIGDGGQGWGNAILYVFLSPTIRHKLFGEPCAILLRRAQDKLLQLLETDADSVTKNSDSPSNVYSRLDLTASETDALLPPRASGYKIQKYASTTTEATVTGTGNTQINHKDMQSSLRSNHNMQSSLCSRQDVQSNLLSSTKSTATRL